MPKPIDDYPLADPLTGVENIIHNQGGITKRMTPEQLKNYVLTPSPSVLTKSVPNRLVADHTGWKLGDVIHQLGVAGTVARTILYPHAPAPASVLVVVFTCSAIGDGSDGGYMGDHFDCSWNTPDYNYSGNIGFDLYGPLTAVEVAGQLASQMQSNFNATVTDNGNGTVTFTGPVEGDLAFSAYSYNGSVNYSTSGGASADTTAGVTATIHPLGSQSVVTTIMFPVGKTAEECSILFATGINLAAPFVNAVATGCTVSVTWKTSGVVVGTGIDIVCLGLDPLIVEYIGDFVNGSETVSPGYFSILDVSKLGAVGGYSLLTEPEYVVKYTDFVATAAGSPYRVDTSPGPVSVTIDPLLRDGEFIDFVDAMGTWGAKPVTFLRGGFTLEGAPANYVDSVQGASIRLLNVGGAVGIRLIEIGVPPNNILPPSVVGSNVGVPLVANPGVWTGSPTSYTYKWQSQNGGVWSDIVGATASTYVADIALLHKCVRVIIAAKNASGLSVTSTSGPSAHLTAVPFPSGAIAYWKLEEASGVRVDATGHGYNLTDTNGPMTSAGKIGSGATFSKSNTSSLGIMDDGDVFNFQSTVSKTFVFWVNFAPNAGDTIIGKHCWDTGADEWWLGDPGYNGHLCIYLSGGTVVQSSFISADNNWHFVVLKWDHTTGTASISVDREIPVFEGGLSPAEYTNSLFSLGASINTSFDGTLDEVGVWSRVLTDAEINMLYNNGAGMTYPTVQVAAHPADDAVAYWKLNETTGVRADTMGGLGLTDRNTTPSVAGILGNAASFNYSQRLDGAIAGSALWTGATVSGWLKTTAGHASSYNQFIGNWGADSQLSGPSWVFQISNAGKFAASFGGSTIGDNVAFPVATWTFFCVRWNGTQLLGRIGNRDLTPLGTTYPPVMEMFALGGGYNGEYGLYGALDEVGIWNRCLTDAEVTKLYNGGAGLAF